MDDLASDDQVDRMADRVLLRIEHRGAQRRAAATIAVTALLFAGGLGLLLTQIHGAGGSASSAGGAPAASFAPSSATSTFTVGCHTSPTRTSSFRTVTVTGAPAPRAAVVACAVDFHRFQSSSGSSEGPSEPASGSAASAAPSSGDLLACRDGAGQLQVFVKDSHPGTLCVRNGLRSP